MNGLGLLYGAVALAAFVLLIASVLVGDTFTIFTSILVLLVAASEVWEHTNG